MKKKERTYLAEKRLHSLQTTLEMLHVTRMASDPDPIHTYHDGKETRKACSLPAGIAALLRHG